jgi:very-short-patch-repair endonuclease
MYQKYNSFLIDLLFVLFFKEKINYMANTTNKNKLLSSWKYNYYVEQIRRTFHVKKNKKDFRVKKHENFIITSLIHDERLRDLKPLTQHYVPLANNNYALIDLYYPQIELAIEVDEPHHLDNIDQDKERQEKIEDLIQCDFRRFAISTEDNEFNTKLFSDIETVKREMIEKINELKSNNVFEEWKPIETLDIEEAKEKYTNTLFIKIKGEFEPEVMYNRYRGRWRLSKKKLPHIKQVIVVHDRVVSKVFLNPVFKRFEEDNKMYFEAEEDSNNEIIGNNITNWEYENSRAYSNDIEQLIKKKK